MKNLRLFETESQYETTQGGGEFEYPTVSYVIDIDTVHYMEKPPHDYSKDYLTFEALEDGTISFNINNSMGTDMITSISYSINNGQTWVTTNNTDNKSEPLVINVSVNQGDKVLWKGIATQTGLYTTEGSFFSSDCEFNTCGNIMSLLYEDDFYGVISLGDSTSTFACLFSDYYGEKTCEVISAQNLILPAITLTSACYASMFYKCTSLTTVPELPATTLASNCYYYMFSGCTSLTTAPELPVTTLARSCYQGMFQDCTSLTTAPELPATTLVESCYQGMFWACTSLTTAPELPATTLAISCYSSMFSGCTSLTTAPELPVTTLARSCYMSMFKGCTSLTTSPELPATTLVNNCYYQMFSDCTSLTTAPELPATTLANQCYYKMFQNCTSLTTAPELPATTLKSDCYGGMFNGCTNLNYIKAMFITTPSTSFTYNWVQGVAPTGTFVKNSAATWTTTGVNGVPSGWTVETASA